MIKMMAHKKAQENFKKKCNLNYYPFFRAIQAV